MGTSIAASLTSAHGLPGWVSAFFATIAAGILVTITVGWLIHRMSTNQTTPGIRRRARLAVDGETMTRELEVEIDPDALASFERFAGDDAIETARAEETDPTAARITPFPGPRGAESAAAALLEGVPAALLCLARAAGWILYLGA